MEVFAFPLHRLWTMLVSYARRTDFRSVRPNILHMLSGIRQTQGRCVRRTTVLGRDAWYRSAVLWAGAPRQEGRKRSAVFLAGGRRFWDTAASAGRQSACPAACRFWWNRLTQQPAYGMACLDGDLPVCIALTPRTGPDQSGLSTMMVVLSRGPVPPKAPKTACRFRWMLAHLCRRSKIRAMPAWAVALATLCGP